MGKPSTCGIRRRLSVNFSRTSIRDKAGAQRLTIVFAMLSETGHYHGSFLLAKALRGRGHRVWYIGLADFAETVEKQGFPFAAIAGDLLPKGYLGCWSDGQSTRTRLFPSQQSSQDKLIFRRFIELINGGGLDGDLLALQPDLLLCDTLVWYVALRAWKLGIPCMQLNLTLSFHPNTRIPPVLFAMQLASARSSRIRTLLAWKYLGMKFLFSKRLASRLFGAYRYPHRIHHLSDEFRRIAAQSGYPLKKGVTYHISELGPVLALDEIVLCPKAFDFPNVPNKPERKHLGSFIDLERSEQVLPEEQMDADRPLVVCSLGTNAFYYPHAPRFFKCVFQASRLEPTWQFVLHLADLVLTDELGTPPKNLLVRSRIPQLDLLRRAAVMVNHGGINSVIECIHFGVPMVILPGLRNQPGVAARAAYHGVARVESMATITPGILVSRVRQAMHDCHIQDAVTRMRRKMESEEGLAAVIARIEHSACNSPRYATHTQSANQKSSSYASLRGTVP